MLATRMESVQQSERKEDYLKFVIDGWSDEELELFELQYTESIDILIDLFPNKNRAELLRAQKDRINRELILHNEKWTPEEIQIVKDNKDSTYNELARILTKRSVWSIVSMKKRLGLTKEKGPKQPWRQLTEEEYNILGELKMNKVHYIEICNVLNIPFSQYQNIMYGNTNNTEILKYRERYPNAVRNTQTYKNWSREEIELLKQLQADGWYLEDIAEVFGLSIAKIRNKLNYIGVSHQDIKTKCKEERKQRSSKKKETLRGLKSEINRTSEKLDMLNKEYTSKLDELTQLKKEIETCQNANLSTQSYHPAIKLIVKHLNNINPIYFEQVNMQNFRMQYGIYKGQSISAILEKDPQYIKFLFQSDLKVTLAIAAAFMNDPSADFLNIN